MLTIKKILFPTDFSEVAERAFSHASRLADRFDAELHVLNVIPPYKPEYATPMEYLSPSDVTEQPRSPLEDMPPRRMEHPSPLAIVHAQVQDVSAPVAVLSYADEHDIDVIVMGTHGRSGVDRWLIGSVSEEVVRLSTCPVLTVHGKGGGSSAVGVERVVVPVDFSEHSRLNITYARELAAAYGARIDLVHVVEDYALAPVYGVEPLALNTPEVLDRVRAGLESMAAEAPGADVPVQVHVLTGNPVNEIIEFASRTGAGLIVIATHGLTGIKRFLMGSVTERVVRSAECPVFTVKTFGKQLVSKLAADQSAEPLPA